MFTNNKPKKYTPVSYDPWWVNEAKNGALSFILVLAITATVLAL